MIDRSLDDLMWLIADEGDHAAVDAFIKRHPEHRAELIKRVNMVRDMRGAKPSEGSSVSPTKFRPTQTVRPLPVQGNPVLRWSGFAVTIVAIGWASFFAASNFMNPNPTVETPVAAPTEAPKNSAATRETSGDPNANVVPPSPPPPMPKTPNERPFTLESDGIDLITLLNLISQQTQLRIEIGPGVENATVSVNYMGLPAMAVLKDLGQKLNFTVFEQEPGHVLLIPAVDPNTIETAPGETPNAPSGESVPRVDVPTESGERLPNVTPN